MRIMMMPVSPLYAIALRWMGESGELFRKETLTLYDQLFAAHIDPFFDGRVDVGEDEVRAFIARKKEEGLAATTIYTMQRILFRVLDYGAAVGECEAPRWDLGLGVPKPEKGATILTVEEQERLERYLVGHPDPKNLCLFLMLTTGISPGEMQELRWEDISFSTSKIRIWTERGTASRPKGQCREIPIGERQKIYLRKLESIPTVYLATGKPRQMSPALLRFRLNRIMVELVLPLLRVSDLRRTYAVRSLEKGTSYRELTKLLGLKDPRDVRAYYEGLLSPQVRQAREKEYRDAFLPRHKPSHIDHPGPDAYPEAVEIRRKIEAKKAELQRVLDDLEFDLDIINSLRNADGVQGKAREGFYRFVEKVLGPDDKDGQYLVEYMRSNMRVAAMPLRVNNVTTVQAIRSRVAHGFAKLCQRIEELNAVEGFDMLPSFKALCEKIQQIAPPAPKRTGPKGKPSVQKDLRDALAALERERRRVEELEERIRDLEASGDS